MSTSRASSSRSIAESSGGKRKRKFFGRFLKNRPHRIRSNERNSVEAESVESKEGVGSPPESKETVSSKSSHSSQPKSTTENQQEKERGSREKSPEGGFRPGEEEASNESIKDSRSSNRQETREASLTEFDQEGPIDVTRGQPSERIHGSSRPRQREEYSNRLDASSSDRSYEVRNATDQADPSHANRGKRKANRDVPSLYPWLEHLPPYTFPMPCYCMPVIPPEFINYNAALHSRSHPRRPSAIFAGSNSGDPGDPLTSAHSKFPARLKANESLSCRQHPHRYFNQEDDRPCNAVCLYCDCRTPSASAPPYDEGNLRHDTDMRQRMPKESTTHRVPMDRSLIRGHHPIQCSCQCKRSTREPKTEMSIERQPISVCCSRKGRSEEQDPSTKCRQEDASSDKEVIKSVRVTISTSRKGHEKPSRDYMYYFEPESKCCRTSENYSASKYGISDICRQREVSCRHERLRKHSKSRYASPSRSRSKSPKRCPPEKRSTAKPCSTKRRGASDTMTKNHRSCTERPPVPCSQEEETRLNSRKHVWRTAPQGSSEKVSCEGEGHQPAKCCKYVLKVCRSGMSRRHGEDCDKSEFQTQSSSLSSEDCDTGANRPFWCSTKTGKCDDEVIIPDFDVKLRFHSDKSNTTESGASSSDCRNIGSNFNNRRFAQLIPKPTKRKFEECRSTDVVKATNGDSNHHTQPYWDRNQDIGVIRGSVCRGCIDGITIDKNDGQRLCHKVAVREEKDDKNSTQISNESSSKTYLVKDSDYLELRSPGEMDPISSHMFPGSHKRTLDDSRRPWRYKDQPNFDSESTFPKALYVDCKEKTRNDAHDISDIIRSWSIIRPLRLPLLTDIKDGRSFQAKSSPSYTILTPKTLFKTTDSGDVLFAAANESGNKNLSDSETYWDNRPVDETGKLSGSLTDVDESSAIYETVSDASRVWGEEEVKDLYYEEPINAQDEIKNYDDEDNKAEDEQDLYFKEGLSFPCGCGSLDLKPALLECAQTQGDTLQNEAHGCVKCDPSTASICLTHTASAGDSLKSNPIRVISSSSSETIVDTDKRVGDESLKHSECKVGNEGLVRSKSLSTQHNFQSHSVGSEQRQSSPQQSSSSSTVCLSEAFEDHIASEESLKEIPSETWDIQLKESSSNSHFSNPNQKGNSSVESYTSRVLYEGYVQEVKKIFENYRKTEEHSSRYHLWKPIGKIEDDESVVVRKLPLFPEEDRKPCGQHAQIPQESCQDKSPEVKGTTCVLESRYGSESQSRNRNEVCSFGELEKCISTGNTAGNQFNADDSLTPGGQNCSAEEEAINEIQLPCNSENNTSKEESACCQARQEGNSVVGSSNSACPGKEKKTDEDSQNCQGWIFCPDSEERRDGCQEAEDKTDCGSVSVNEANKDKCKKIGWTYGVAKEDGCQHNHRYSPTACKRESQTEAPCGEPRDTMLHQATETERNKDGCTMESENRCGMEKENMDCCETVESKGECKKEIHGKTPCEGEQGSRLSYGSEMIHERCHATKEGGRQCLPRKEDVCDVKTEEAKDICHETGVEKILSSGNNTTSDGDCMEEDLELPCLIDQENACVSEKGSIQQRCDMKEDEESPSSTFIDKEKVCCLERSKHKGRDSMTNDVDNSRVLNRHDTYCCETSQIRGQCGVKRHNTHCRKTDQIQDQCIVKRQKTCYCETREIEDQPCFVKRENTCRCELSRSKDQCLVKRKNNSSCKTGQIKHPCVLKQEDVSCCGNCCIKDPCFVRQGNKICCETSELKDPCILQREDTRSETCSIQHPCSVNGENILSCCEICRIKDPCVGHKEKTCCWEIERSKCTYPVQRDVASPCFIEGQRTCYNCESCKIDKCVCYKKRCGDIPRVVTREAPWCCEQDETNKRKRGSGIPCSAQCEKTICCGTGNTEYKCHKKRHATCTDPPELANTSFCVPLEKKGHRNTKVDMEIQCYVDGAKGCRWCVPLKSRCVCETTCRCAACDRALRRQSSPCSKTRGCRGTPKCRKQVKCGCDCFEISVSGAKSDQGTRLRPTKSVGTVCMEDTSCQRRVCCSIQTEPCSLPSKHRPPQSPCAKVCKRGMLPREFKKKRRSFLDFENRVFNHSLDLLLAQRSLLYYDPKCNFSHSASGTNANFVNPAFGGAYGSVSPSCVLHDAIPNINNGWGNEYSCPNGQSQMGHKIFERKKRRRGASAQDSMTADDQSLMSSASSTEPPSADRAQTFCHPDTFCHSPCQTTPAGMRARSASTCQRAFDTFSYRQSPQRLKVLTIFRKLSKNKMSYFLNGYIQNLRSHSFAAKNSPVTVN